GESRVVVGVDHVLVYVDGGFDGASDDGAKRVFDLLMDVSLTMPSTSRRVAIPSAVALPAAGDLLDVVDRDGFDCASLGGYGGAANTFPTCRSRAALVGAVSVH